MFNGVDVFDPKGTIRVSGDQEHHHVQVSNLRPQFALSLPYAEDWGFKSIDDRTGPFAHTAFFASSDQQGFSAYVEIHPGNQPVDSETYLRDVILKKLLSGDSHDVEIKSPVIERQGGNPVLDLRDSLSESAALDLDPSRFWIAAGAHFTHFGTSLGLEDGPGVQFMGGYSADSRCDAERKLGHGRGQESYFRWGPEIGFHLDWSHAETTGSRASAITLFAGYLVDYTWPNGLTLGSSLSVGEVYFQSASSGVPSRHGLSLGVSIPEIGLSLGAGFGIRVSAFWEFDKTSFNTDHSRWTWEFSPMLSLTWEF
jgi:hypothetical protein